MKCRICNQNETDSSSGICWECLNKWFTLRELAEQLNQNPMNKKEDNA